MAPATSLTTWEALRNLLVVAGLSLAATASAAIFAEGQYARPLCQAYGRERQLTYVRFEYPPSRPTGVFHAGSSCYCVFAGGGTSTTDVDFQKVAPNYLTYLLVYLATTAGVTLPLFFVMFALGLAGIYGALGIKLVPAKGN